MAAMAVTCNQVIFFFFFGGGKFPLMYLSEDLLKHTPSQQPIGSQIIRICIGIYRKIDKTVKMYINSY